MKILMVMDPGIPVPPKGYGGHERLVYMFAKEYHRLGHDITLLVSPGSEFPEGRVVTFGKDGYPKPKWEGRKDIFRAWKYLIPHHKEYDLIHNFGRLAYLLPCLNSRVKKIMTYGREVDSSNISFINKLPNRNLVFTASSDDCVSSGNVAGRWVTVYNAIDFSKYTPTEAVTSDAPLMFLSRLERVKGCHVAIDVAKKTGIPLIIAGNISKLPEELDYFNNEIKPHIDGVQIKYVGTVDDEQKNYYLSRARALLFPIDVREAFGMVMAEAMACGTPVIGFPMGAVPEVIVGGVNGYLVNNKEEMIDAVKKIPAIDRVKCRENAEARFDVKVLAAQYLNLFS